MASAHIQQIVRQALLMQTLTHAVMSVRASDRGQAVEDHWDQKIADAQDQIDGLIRELHPYERDQLHRVIVVIQERVGHVQQAPEPAPAPVKATADEDDLDAIRKLATDIEIRVADAYERGIAAGRQKEEK